MALSSNNIYGTNFSDAFWDEQNKGVDIIIDRLRKSKETCEQVKKIYELRANIEQEYGEKLLALTTNLRIGEFEENSFAEALVRIPSILETAARAHIDLSQQLRDHLEVPLNGFLNDQREIRKMQQQKIENSKQLKHLHEADVLRAKDYYKKEYEILVSLESNLLKLNNEDLIEKIKDQKRIVTVAEKVYKRSVDNLNSINKNWINEWTLTTIKFQEMEEKRIKYLTDTLWTFSNIMITGSNADEESYNHIRSSLDFIDIKKDISKFVQKYGTGVKQPAFVTYEILDNTISNSVTLSSKIEKNNNSKKSSSLPSTNLPNATNSGTTKTSSVIVLTNPDEELKSVDRQLKQIERQNTVSRQLEHQKNKSLTYSEKTEECRSGLEIDINQNSDLRSKNATKKGINRNIVNSSGILDNTHELNYSPVQLRKTEDSSVPNHSIDPSDSFLPPHLSQNLDYHIPSPPYSMKLSNPSKEPKTSSSSSFNPSRSEYIHTTPEITIDKSSSLYSGSNHRDVLKLSQSFTMSQASSSPYDHYREIASPSFKNDIRTRSSLHETKSLVEDPIEKNPPKIPKAHRPPIPLKIDIPNAIPKPQPPRQNRTEHKSSHEPFYDPPVRTSSLEFSRWAQQRQKESQQKRTSTSQETGLKPTKSTSRFSLGFFGHRKEKKKEKERLGFLRQKLHPVNQYQELVKKHNPNYRMSNFIGFVKAQWSFDATVVGELSFDTNEILGIIAKQDDGWWVAERLNTGQTGLIPGNYVIDSPVPY